MFNYKNLCVFISIFFCCAFLNCSQKPQNTDVRNAVVTTSWLECCVKDIAGDDIEVVRLCPPGSCPGHFDMKPGVLSDLNNSEIMFRFDFQKSLDDKLSSFAENGLVIASVTAPEGLCIPSSYLKCCEMVCSTLSNAYPDKKDKYDESLGLVRVRIKQLEEKILDQVEEAGLKGTKIVSSGHQSCFCRWLGMDTIACYSGAESTSPSEMEKLLDKGKEAGIKYIIANLQEGKQVGSALAFHLKATMVTFSNFPTMEDSQNSFDELVEDNVKCLLTANQ